MRQLLALSVSLGLVIVSPRDAHPQSPAADALFEQGRQALAAGQLDTACARFRASDQLDAAVGTRANLGDCEERRGRVASAWEAFRGAVEKAPAGDRRIPAYQKRIKALEARLPWLVLTLAPDAPKGTTVREDEVTIGARATFGVPLTLDPGVHHLKVFLPGRPVKSLDVTLTEGKTTKVAIEPDPAEPDAAVDGFDQPRRVHLRSESPVSLFAVVPEGARLVCGAPCGRVIAPGLRTFFIGGDAVTSSEHFGLHPRGETTIRVRAGSSARRAGGIVLATVGSAVVVIGSIFMATALGSDPALYSDITGLSPGAAAGLSGAGVAAGVGLVVGGAVLIRQGRTTVDVLASRAASGPSPLFRF